MSLKKATMAGVGLMMAVMLPGMAAAEAKIYPYHGQNFCPAGLQPVTLGGVICCGTPNQHISYNQAMAHPVKKRHRVVHRTYSARPSCPPGTKGCN